ncbi:hypothetical protein [Nostoc sp. FACHB-133]|uniref:hypothetical protein n=1 Tax=Nostoc sp. FACHB-133 TaxID=2692835 RepID=UPI0016892189|nr:hypothetical protein [Nostoc sp. FACHB-133]MBD2527694.1 hypothetical protein [Nostoc sp. FACHB-133]
MVNLLPLSSFSSNYRKNGRTGSNKAAKQSVGLPTVKELEILRDRVLKDTASAALEVPNPIKVMANKLRLVVEKTRSLNLKKLGMTWDSFFILVVFIHL